MTDTNSFFASAPTVTEASVPVTQQAQAPVVNTPVQATPVVTPQAQTTPVQTPGNAWYEGLPQEDLAFLHSHGWNGPDAPIQMLKSYKQLASKIGIAEDRLLKLPANLEDAEQMASVYNRLGRPETPEAYQYKKSDDIQLEFGLGDEQRIQNLAKVAHELGLSKKQFQAFVDAGLRTELEAARDVQRMHDTQQEQEINRLRMEWGPAFNERLELARQAATRFGLSEGAAGKLAQSIGGDAEVLRFLSTIGQQLMEHSTPQAAVSGRGFGMTPDNMLEEVNKIIGDVAKSGDLRRQNEFSMGRSQEAKRVAELNRLYLSATSAVH